jgi:hypothetical protein
MGKETGGVKGKVAALVGPAEVAVKEFVCLLFFSFFAGWLIIASIQGLLGG